MPKSFRDLIVWQKAVDLTAEVYRLTAAFPSHERYGLTSQMCRAAVSIASNIAEGSGRESKKDFRHFVLIAKGSANELQTQLIISRRLGYSTTTEIERAERAVMELGRMLNGLATFLRDQIREQRRRVIEAKSSTRLIS